MCFIIDEQGKKPRVRTVWKWVRLRADGYLCSPIRRTRQTWQPGAVMTAKPPYTDRCRGGPSWRSPLAENGIYVFLDYATAWYTARKWNLGLGNNTWVIIKCHVDPKDFLYRGKHRDVNTATYKQVTVAEEQPYLSWY